MAGPITGAFRAVRTTAKALKIRTSDVLIRLASINGHVLEIDPIHSDGTKSVVFMGRIEDCVPS